MISLLWRHGARTPYSNVFSAPYDQVLGTKELFGNGARMHYVLGTQLSQKAYPQLFTDISQTKYEIYSTQTTRTNISAISLAMGLFPLGKGPEITPPPESSAAGPLPIQLPPFKGLDPQLIPTQKFALPDGVLPIPITTINEKDDDLFNKGMEYKCPIQFEKQKAAGKQNYITNATMFDKSFKPDMDKDFPIADFKKFKSYEKATAWDMQYLGYVSDEFKCYKYFMGEYDNKSGVSKSYYWKMKYVFGILMLQDTYSLEASRRVWTDKMSQRVVSEFQTRIAASAADNKSLKKLNFFGLSGHETNIVPFMLGYQLTSEKCMLEILNSGKDRVHTSLEDADLCLGGPDFASSLVWEMSRKKSAAATSTSETDYFIRVVYNGEPLVTHCPKDKLVDKYYCPFTAFKASQLEKFQFATPQSREEVCTIPSKSFPWNVLAFVLLGVLLTVVIIYVIVQRRKSAEGDVADLSDGLETNN